MKIQRLTLMRFQAVVKQFIFLTFIVTAFAFETPLYAFDDGEESIEVTCYKKDVNQGSELGNVSVTKLETAAVNCNATYYDCQDKCIGCFTDPKLNQTVCYNAVGAKVSQ